MPATRGTAPVHLELDAGEAVLLHNWTLHRSGTNATAIARRAFSVCYMDAATRSHRRQTFPPIFDRDGRAVPGRRLSSALHRTRLLAALDRYQARYPDEDQTRFRGFVLRQPRCFERDCWDDGHVTGSALVVDRTATRVLLTHHAKVGRWLQLGGHADGDPDPLAVACREATEESGLAVTPLHGRHHRSRHPRALHPPRPQPRPLSLRRPLSCSRRGTPRPSR